LLTISKYEYPEIEIQGKKSRRGDDVKGDTLYPTRAWEIEKPRKQKFLSIGYEITSSAVLLAW
jgi:hypothetical protein